MKDRDDDSDVRRLERGGPIDWTIPYDRFQWTNAVREHVFRLFGQAWLYLSESRTPRYRAVAKRMHLHNDLLLRLFYLVGFPARRGSAPSSRPRRGAARSLLRSATASTHRGLRSNGSRPAPASSGTGASTASASTSPPSPSTSSVTTTCACASSGH